MVADSVGVKDTTLLFTKLFVNKNVVNAVVTGVTDLIFDPNRLEMFVYPNPVAASSQFVFSIPTTSTVTVSLTDLQGKTLSRQNLGILGKGRHQVNLSAVQPGMLQWSKGIYLLTLSASNGSITTRIVL